MDAPASPQPVLIAALLSGLLAAVATAAGAVPGALGWHLGDRSRDTLLGFGGGVMLAACAFSLVLPGIESAQSLGFGAWSAASMVAFALAAGAIFVMGLNAAIPHEHFIKGAEGRSSHRLKRTWLFVFAVCLHNLPEGIAIGVAHAESAAQGRALATGIALQDIPEGLVVTVSLIAAGYRRLHAVLVGAASGLPEPVGAVIGAAVASTQLVLLPVGLGFAAGAMLFVISHEIIPESHRSGHEQFATMGLVFGFMLMMVLDTAMGA